MDKKSKIFFWVIALLIVTSVGVTYWRIMIKKDYIIEAQADCDQTTEKCFVSVCDPKKETCTGNPDEDTTYFKKIKRNASNIPLCDPADETCHALVCPEGEKDCTVTLCDEKTKTKDEECSDPEQYNIDHPAVDETDSSDVTTCDTEQDPTCADSASSTDESDTTDNSDTTASQQ